MKRTIFLLAGFFVALPVSAAPTVSVKCEPNQERVWVYDNLTTWDVAARLKCGTPVNVLGLQNGYVRVRTADGNEGYVPADAIPASQLAQLAAAAGPAPVITVAAAARANMQSTTESESPQASAPAPPVANTVMVAERAESQPAPAPPSNAVPPAAPAPATPPAQQSAPSPAHIPTPAAAPAPAPSTPNTTRASAAPVASAQASIVIEPVVMSDMSEKTVAPARVIAKRTPSPQPLVSANATAPESPNASSRDDSTLVVEEVDPPAPAMKESALATVVKTANFTPVRTGSAAAVRAPEYSDDDEALPEADAAPSEDLANCNVYFSAYGVTPMQYKWIADERLKKFPGVCPAPEPSMVDYVVIFTHDMDFFSTTLPDPIHTDTNGFSDWSPVTSVDDAQIPVSSLDKAHREYAWVFRVHRGTFDPGKFTARRRPQYAKTASNSSRSIEDAMQFMATSSVSQ
ncbi:MAG TPA: SH3 domain-containing protein [Candidatus Aquilonibacter sp.]|nr:SH3 domain-containing protein [Candidatus Aquilonibacter sp.]